MRDAYNTQYAAQRRDLRVPSPSPSLSHSAPETIEDSPRRAYLCRPSSNRRAVNCTMLYCPVLSSVPSPHTYARTDIGIWACVVFAGHHFEPDKSPPFQSLKCLGCCSFTSTALHCTGTAGWDWTGWRRCWAWLPSERASKAVELLRCAPGLPGPSHHWILSTVHCPLQISTHRVPPSIPTRLSTPPPQTRLRHLSLSSLLSPPRTHLWAP